MSRGRRSGFSSRAQIFSGERGWLVLVLLGYLLVTLAYGVVNPLFEAPDEHWHYFTAQYIADTGQLPMVTETYDTWLGQEAAQPPLYYWLGSWLIRLVDVGEAREQVWLNPHFATAVGDASALANKNLMVHTEAEKWPWQGVTLAGHLLRGVSALLGLGTLLCVYGCGRLLWPDVPQRALLAMALVAFLPQFNFVHASITNDVLITLLASLVLWQVLALWRGSGGAGEQAGWQRLLLLGVTIGLAALTKTAGILLLVYVVAVLVLMWWEEGNGRLRQISQIILFVIVPVLLMAGWMWWRNWLLYGDITAANQFVKIAGGDRGYTLGQVLAETPGLWLSLFAVFGWFNVRPPEWVYGVWQGMVVVGLVGVLWQRNGGAEERERQAKGFRLLPFVVLAGWVLLVYAGLVIFMLRTPAAQGRLLFPAIVPLALGLAYGLSRFRWVMWLAPLLGLVTTLVGLWVVGETYERPSTITILPEDVPVLDATMGQGLTLLAARVETETAVPGDAVWLTLYWRAETVPVEPPELVLELFGQELELPIGKVQSYHGRGLYPANLWAVGEIVVDRVGVRVESGEGLPVLAQAFVQLVGSGEQEAALVGEVKVTPLVWPKPPGEELVLVGEGVAVTAVSMMPTIVKPGDVVTVKVEWQVVAVPNGDFTTFVHLAEAGQPPLATGDGVPGNGRYPTRVWAAGEAIRDAYSFVVPEGVGDGRYPVWLGMYDPVSGVRLPLTVGGVRQPNEAYLAGWLTIEQ